MDVVRRNWLTAPGEYLIFPGDPMEWASNRAAATSDFGLRPDGVMWSPMGVFPIPVFSQPTPRGVPGISAAMLWHPVLWLPADVIARRILERDEQGNPTLAESDSHLVMRVMQTLALSGLYDQETGTWVDVLASRGLTLPEGESVERAKAWLGGQADPVFDGVDLSPYLATVDQDEVYAIVDELEGMAFIQHHTNARSVVEALGGEEAVQFPADRLAILATLLTQTMGDTYEDIVNGLDVALATSRWTPWSQIAADLQSGALTAKAGQRIMAEQATLVARALYPYAARAMHATAYPLAGTGVDTSFLDSDFSGGEDIFDGFDAASAIGSAYTQFAANPNVEAQNALYESMWAYLEQNGVRGDERDERFRRAADVSQDWDREMSVVLADIMAVLDGR